MELRHNQLLFTVLFQTVTMFPIVFLGEQQATMWWFYTQTRSWVS